MKNKSNTNKGGKMLVHAILGIVLLIVILIIISRLNVWNKRSTSTSVNTDPDSSMLECLDYYCYPNEVQKNHRVEGKTPNILVIGNKFLYNHDDNGKTLYDYIAEKTNGNLINLVATASRIGLKTYPKAEDAYDYLGLYRVVDYLCTKDYSIIDDEYSELVFSDKKQHDDYFDTLLSVDLNDIDKVLIMYNLIDYYDNVPSYGGSDEYLCSTHGSLMQSILMLQDKYPHLEIIVSSQVPSYLKKADGTLELSSATDYFGWGTSSYYFTIEYNISQSLFVSFIDNYYYMIDEDNITEYVSELELNGNGVKVIADHVASFLNR